MSDDELPECVDMDMFHGANGREMIEIEAEYDGYVDVRTMPYATYMDIVHGMDVEHDTDANSHEGRRVVREIIERYDEIREPDWVPAYDFELPDDFEYDPWRADDG